MRRFINLMFAFISVNSFQPCKNMGNMSKDTFNKAVLFKAHKLIEINIVCETGTIPWIYRWQWSMERAILQKYKLSGRLNHLTLTIRSTKMHIPATYWNTNHFYSLVISLTLFKRGQKGFPSQTATIIKYIL